MCEEESAMLVNLVDVFTNDGCELPVYFALASAEYFAQGAVSLMDRLGVTDVLHFGSECGDCETDYIRQ